MTYIINCNDRNICTTDKKYCETCPRNKYNKIDKFSTKPGGFKPLGKYMSL